MYVKTVVVPARYPLNELVRQEGMRARIMRVLRSRCFVRGNNAPIHHTKSGDMKLVSGVKGPRGQGVVYRACSVATGEQSR